MEISNLAYNSFWYYFWDSVYLLHESKKYQPNTNKTFYRASIISIVLSLESAANACIYSLNLDNGFFNDIEKLDCLSKLNFFSYTKFQKTIDKSNHVYGDIKQFIRHRNNLVHPKILECEPEASNFRIKTDFGSIKSLEIPNDTQRLDINNVIKMIETAVTFLNYYFIDLCDMSKQDVTNILLGDDQSTIQGKTFLDHSFDDQFKQIYSEYCKEEVRFIVF